MAYLLCYSYTCSKLERHHYSFLRACEKIALNYAMRRSWPPTPNRKSEIPRSAPQAIKSKIPSFVPPRSRKNRGEFRKIKSANLLAQLTFTAHCLSITGY